MPVSHTSRDEDAAARKRQGPAKRARLLAQKANGTGGDNLLMVQSGLDEQACRELQSWYTSVCRATGGEEVFAHCRRFASGNDFVRQVVAAKKLLFGQGLTLTGTKTRQQKAELTRLVSDIWTEWLTCDNAIAAWVEAPRAEFPFVSVPNCEDCRYSNALGVESLKLRLPASDLTEEAKRKLGRRYADAIRTRNVLEWGGEDHPKEHFQSLLAGTVHPSGKAGGGFGMPSLFSVFEALATYALLSTSDRSAAWMAKDVIRAISKGHEVKGGPLEGQPVYDLKKKEKKIIHDEMANKSGAFEVVKNWDVLMEYIVFDNEFFNAAKWAGACERVMRWAGPVGYLYAERKLGGIETAELLRLLSIEAAAHRAAVADFVQDIGAACGVPELKVTFSSSTFMTWAALTEFVNTATATGLMSPETGREHLGLDHARESARLEASHAKPLTVTPVFQRAQGLTEPLQKAQDAGNPA